MKKNVLLVFGGRSTEHEVSIMSAATMDEALDRRLYDVYKVYIDKEGSWKYTEANLRELNTEELRANGADAMLVPGRGKARLIIRSAQGEEQSVLLDVAVPAMHGKNGEDGTIQGLFEMMQLPYVGCGVMASAVSLDKITTKKVVGATVQVRQARYVAAFADELEDMDKVAERVENTLTYPVYVKPSAAGSSVGVSKAENRDALKKALLLAADNDSRILIEESISGREVECAVLGSARRVEASGVGEILAADEFYTYDAKYNNAESRTVLDPDLESETVEAIRRAAVEIFMAVGGSGLSRVDFFVEHGTNQVIFNEINTMPGFTKISMYPMLWNHRGVTNTELMNRLIQLGLER